MQSNNGVTQQIDLEVGLQSGFALTGGDFDNSGKASITLMPDSCQFLSIVLEADSSRRVYSRALLPVTASSPAEYCMDAGNELDALSILVENCALGQEGFTCPCEGEGGINIDAGGGARLSDIIFNGDLPGSTLNNTCLAISGRLEVDVNYLIDGGEIRMQPGSEIVVETFRSLTLQNINQNRGIHGCEQMWRGIVFTGGGGSFTMNDCRIEDAQYAVTILSAFGGTTPINFEGNNFNRNYVGIYFPDNGGGFSPLLFNMEANTFQTAGAPLLPPFDNNPGPFPVLDKGYTGILAFTKFGLGFDSSGPLANNFDNLFYGVILENCSNWELSNANFTDISRGAIFTTDDNRLTANSNTLIDCDVGILSLAPKTRQEFIGNYFLRGQTAIGAYGTGLTSFEITNNSMQEVDAYGVILSGVKSSAEVTITNNTIDLIEGVFTTRAGVSVSQFAPVSVGDPSSTRVIAGNTITFEDGDGIKLSYSPGFTIENCTLTTQGIDDNTKGIHLVSSEGVTVVGNILEDTGADMATEGIRIDASRNVDVRCNTMDGFKRNLYFGMDCGCIDFSDPATCTNVQGNAMNARSGGTVYSGLILDQAIVSQQEKAGNEWTGVNSSSLADFYDARFIGDVLLAQLSEFVIHTPNAPYYPNRIQVTGGTPSAWFDIDPDVSFFMCPEMLVSPTNSSGIAERIAEGLLYPNSPGAQWITERHLYASLKAAPHSIVPGTIDSFYTVKQSQPIGSFYNIEATIDAARQLSTVQQDSLEALAQKRDSLALELESAPPASLPSLRRQLYLAHYNLQEYEASLASARQEQLQRALADIQSISASSLQAQNLQAALELSIQQQMFPESEFSTAQISQSEAIAGQCIAEGGDGVILARQLLGWEDWGQPCSALSPLIKHGNSNTACSQTAASLYPNPTQGELWLRTAGLETEHAVFLEIYALSGQLLRRQNHLPNDVQAVSFEGWPQGVYLYRVVQNGQVLSNGKLIQH